MSGYNPKNPDAFNQEELPPVPPPLSFLNFVEAPSGVMLQDGDFQSPNFRTGISGWRIRSDGTVEFGDGYFRGDITGATGTFSGTVTVGSINIPGTSSSNSFHVSSLGNTWWGNNEPDGYADAPAYILNTGQVHFQSGDIAGWQMSTNSLVSGSGTSTVAFSTADTGDDDVRIYAGSSTPGSAPYRVYESGSVVMNNATVTGVLTAQAGSTLFDFQVFDVAGSSTWAKPTATSTNSPIIVECWGGGGGGGSVAATTGGGGGGGGGGYKVHMFRASDITATVAVTVASGGTAGTAGGNSSFGTYLTAYGGGGGFAGDSGLSRAGGGGGGISAAGADAVSNVTGGTGGGLLGGAGGSGAAGGDSSFGGGGGTNGSNNGGSSVYGGGGGGGNTSTGRQSIYGGAGGQNGGLTATAATSEFGGNGGTGASSGTDANGGDGTQPGGGGGGANRNTVGSATGGSGAPGMIKIWTLI